MVDLESALAISHLSISEVEMGTEYHDLATNHVRAHWPTLKPHTCVQLDDPTGVICNTVQKLIG